MFPGMTRSLSRIVLLASLLACAVGVRTATAVPAPKEVMVSHQEYGDPWEDDYIVFNPNSLSTRHAVEDREARATI